jgi:hypothetical protein
MPKPGTPTGSRAGATPLRDALIAWHDRDMERWLSETTKQIARIIHIMPAAHMADYRSGP